MRVVRAVSPEQREAALALRFEVFVDEQGVSVDGERDALDDDPTTIHILVVSDDADAEAPSRADVLGVGRVLRPKDDGRPHVGRVAVPLAARRTGVGTFLMEALERAALEAWAVDGEITVALSAQVQAIPFYEAIGYTVYGERYLDEGIWHRDAVKTVRPLAGDPTSRS